ncbi:WD40-repeat-containing domain protein [Aspergillus minisclerotigenes]|uniref:Mitochondrial division protein 1 n=1 Tax=Aspergillus minisclerotigenes TaxID=656917 RepID=A0A5N6IYP9_9EURO|nr:WD40-repeat-containing domain protein [Aspergillus minisclerotigenes]
MFLRSALIVGLPTILGSFPLRSSRHTVSTSTHPKEPITSPSPQVPPGPEEGFEPETKSDTASVPPEGPESILWDEAYDLLKIEKPDLLSDYESLLSRVATEARRQKLQQIAKLSFEKMQEGKLHATFFGKKIVLQEAIGTLGNGINWAQTYAKDALKEEQVKGLYKLVIDYQVQSVMRFDRNPVKNYFRSVTDYDVWSDQLNTIKEEEKTLKMRFQVALSALSVQKLNDLERDVGKSRETLEEVANDTRKIEKHLSDAEYRRCLNTLKATDPQLDKQRIEKLKGGLLKDSYNWVIENQEFKRWMDASSGELLWIKGDPGKGKTMLLCGIIDELSQLAAPGTNIAFFFCQASVETLDNYPAVLRGLISMLVKQQPSLMSHLFEASFDGHNAWLALQNTLTNILNDPTLQSTYLLIDGLDECVRDRQNLLDLLVEHSSAHENIKWIVSSRNWPGIEEDLHLAKKIKLHLELNETVLSKAIQSFIEYRVQKLENRSNGSKGKTDIWKAVKDHLVENANGTFLWVALVCEHLAKMFYWEVREKLRDFPPHLEKIYERMMSQVIDSDKSVICKAILGVTTTVLRPVTLDEMMVYVDIPGDDARALEDLVGLCGSFLSVQENTIFLIHQSAKDFIMGTASSEIFPHGKDMIHYDLFCRSLHLLRESLRRDIYNLRAPGYPIQQIPIWNPDPLRAVRYACVYWVDHIVSCGNIEDIKKAIAEKGLVDSFLQQSYLHWLEAMSILKSIPSGISSMQKLEKFIQKWMNAEPKFLVHRVRDAIRFVQYTKVAIESCPLQVYYSSLIYSPMQSITRECYDDRQSIRDWIRKEPVVESCWSPCLQTLEGHTDVICSLAWSRDGSRLASGAYSSARIWDLDTSECSGRCYSINCLAWSPDGSRLAAGSLYPIVNVWDTQTRDCVLRKGHASRITSVAWSSDGSRLASGSADRTIRIWDVRTMDCVFILEGQFSVILCLAWSPDGSRLASASMDDNIKIWDTTSQFKSITRGHDEILESITWSHDGVQLVSLAEDRTVRVRNTTTGGQLSIFQGRPNIRHWHTDYIHKLVWSPDGNQLASGSGDGTVRVWNPTTGDQLSISRDHINDIRDIAWSPDRRQLASVSADSTIRVWNPTTGDQLSISGDHIKRITYIAWFPDGSQLISVALDGTAQVWNPTTGDQLSISGDGIKRATDIAWSPDGSQLASSPDGSQLTSVALNGTVWVWNLTTENPASGQCISKFPVATGDLLRFDSIDPNYLYTRLGTFDMRGLKRASRGSNDSNHVPAPHGYGLSEDLSWITYDGTKVLWLPPDHRPQDLSAVALSNLAVAIGCASGALEILEFSTLNPLSDL